MQIFASTTFLGNERTRVTDVVRAMRNTSLDGIELGSTHLFETEDVLLALREIWPGRILTHNFFPPSADEAMVLNLAAQDPQLREQSVAHCRYCIDIAARLGAELYTVHPGFMAPPLAAASSQGESHYDFTFGDARIPHQAAIAASLESLGALSEHARKAGVTLAIETEGSITRPGILLMETPAEFELLFAALPDIKLNFNLAHTSLSAKAHGFDIADFIARFGAHFAAVELSHNDGHSDQHAALVPGSYVLSWINKLPDIPWILEFRNASIEDLEHSAVLIRAAKQGEKP